MRAGVVAALGGVVIALAVVVVAVVGYQGGWWLHKNAVNREYQINRTGQAMQAGDIAHARSLEEALATTHDQGQRIAFTNEYCALFVDIDPGSVPADLENTHTQYCH